MIRVRLKFEKYGPIRFIGHLDVMRYFQKVMRRAGIDIAYSEGYSPHQLMSFAHPLTVGATSDAEYMDITLNSFMDVRTKEILTTDEESGAEALIARMNAHLNEGIRITDSCVLKGKAVNAMASVCACRWKVSLRNGMPQNLRGASLEKALSGLMRADSLPVVKKTKKKETTWDIRPYIYEAVCDKDDALILLLSSGSENNVKPVLVLNALTGTEHLPQDLVLHRLETYRYASEDAQNVIEPLICKDAKYRIHLSVPTP